MRSFNGYEKSILNKLCQVDPFDLITISRFISDNVFTVESGMALGVIKGSEPFYGDFLTQCTGL